MFKKILLILLSLFMIVAGINHFKNPNFYLKMMPPYLPFHLELVYLSGVVEVLCGILLLIPKTKIWGAWLCILTFLAIFRQYLYAKPEFFKIPEVMPLYQAPLPSSLFSLFTKKEKSLNLF